MKKSGLFWLAWALIFSAGVYAVQGAPKQKLDTFWAIPGFSMSSVSSNGTRPLKAAELSGRPWVASFIFTRCSGPCPLLSARMAELQRTLPREVRLVSFSVDPDGDTPEKLRSYAAAFDADPQRWLFVRGERAGLYKLLYEGFKLPIAGNPSGGEGFQVTHSTKLVLVDAHGMIRGFYDGLSSNVVQAVQADVRRLARESV